MRTYHVVLEPFMSLDTKWNRNVEPIIGSSGNNTYEFYLTYDNILDPMTISKTRRHTIDWEEEFRRCRRELLTSLVPAGAHVVVCFSNPTTLTGTDIGKLTRDRAASPIARDFKGRPISDYLYFHLVLGSRVEWYHYSKLRLPEVDGDCAVEELLVVDVPPRYQELLLDWCQGGVILPTPDVAKVTEWCRTGREKSAELLEHASLLFWNSRDGAALELVTPGECREDLRSRGGVFNMNLRLERLSKRLM